MNKAQAIQAAKQAGLTITKETPCGRGTEFKVGDNRLHNEHGYKQTWMVDGKEVGGGTVTDCILHCLGINSWCGRPQ